MVKGSREKQGNKGRDVQGRQAWTQVCPGKGKEAALVLEKKGDKGRCGAAVKAVLGGLCS